MKESYYLDIHKLLQQFYLQRRMIRMQYRVGILGISEAQILIEAFANNGLTSARLSEILKLEKSTISRTVNSLCKRKLIKIERSTSDRRVKTLRITLNGRKMVHELQDSQKKVLEHCLKTLNHQEQIELADCMKALADGLGVGSATILPGDDLITTQIVRLGRATGMTGVEFMDSALSSSHYHFLRNIGAFAGEISISELGKLMPFDRSVVSRTIKQLKTKKLISRAENHSSVLITAMGINAIETVDKKATSLIKRGLLNVSSNTIERFVFLLHKVTIPDFESSSVLLSEHILIKKFLTLEQRQQARAFALREMLHENESPKIPDVFFAPKNKNFGLFIAGQLSAVCELCAFEKNWSLNNLFAPRLRETLKNQFIQACFSEA